MKFHRTIRLMLLLPFFFIFSCNKSVCLKEKLTNGRYYMEDLTTKKINTYFTMSDSTHNEYSFNYGMRTYESHVTWKSCSSYLLTIAKINIADSSFLKVNDSALIELLSFDKDTFHFRMTFNGQSMESRFYLMKDSVNTGNE